MADVFISYKAERRAAAQHMASVLTAYGYSVWWDYALVAGRDFTRQIENELKNAKAVVVLWCGLSRDSEWVRQEALFAKSRDKAVPVFIEAVELPFGFQIDHTVNLAGWDGAPRDAATIEPLLRELARLTGRAPSPDAAALERLDAAWRAKGAPRMAQFALGPTLETHTPVFTTPAAQSGMASRLKSPLALALLGAAALAVTAVALWPRGAPDPIEAEQAQTETELAAQAETISDAIDEAAVQASRTPQPAVRESAAPPPACVIAPFNVYFDYDRTNLGTSAQDALEDALLRARRCEILSVAIVGHDETEASPQYSIRVSERRAAAVRDFLVAQGVDAQRISTEARGQSALAVDTGPGVREALNRRATVRFEMRLRD